MREGHTLARPPEAAVAARQTLLEVRGGWDRFREPASSIVEPIGQDDAMTRHS
jgi:hypothetical protein